MEPLDVGLGGVEAQTLESGQQLLLRQLPVIVHIIFFEVNFWVCQIIYHGYA